MYGHSKLGIYGFKPNPTGRKRGRPSNKSKFFERQLDLFPVDLALARVAPHYMPGSAPGQDGTRGSAARPADRVSVLPGELVILAGLQDDKREEQRDRLPFLGWLLGVQEQDRQSEILVLIEAHRI